MARIYKPPRVGPMPTTAEAYERAVARAEETFKRNKSSMWILKILREYLAAEGQAEDVEADLAQRKLEDQP